MVRAKHPDQRTGNNWKAVEKREPMAMDTGEEFVPPPAPATLAERGVQFWEAVWAVGGPAYRPSDVWVIERYADLSARREKFLETLAEEGWTAPGSTGQLTAHPVAGLLKDVEAKLTTLEDRLGLSPESRVRLGLHTAQAQKTAAEAMRDALDDE